MRHLNRCLTLSPLTIVGSTRSWECRVASLSRLELVYTNPIPHHNVLIFLFYKKCPRYLSIFPTQVINVHVLYGMNKTMLVAWEIKLAIESSKMLHEGRIVSSEM